MKNGYIFKKNLLRFFFLTLASCFIVACNDDDDATNSLDNRTSLVLTPSDYEIELKEDTPDEVALTLNWTYVLFGNRVVSVNHIIHDANVFNVMMLLQPCREKVPVTFTFS